MCGADTAVRRVTGDDGRGHRAAGWRHGFCSHDFALLRMRATAGNGGAHVTYPKKCAHKVCVCLVNKDSEFGDYCSQHCKDAGDMIELKCDCGHDACMADQAGKAPR